MTREPWEKMGRTERRAAWSVAASWTLPTVLVVVLNAFGMDAA